MRRGISVGQIKQLDCRFEKIARGHMERWEAEHPMPAVPEVGAIERDLKRGKFTLDRQEMRGSLASYLEDDEWERDVFKVFRTPTIDRFLAAVKEWETAKKVFESRMRDALTAYRDRVLFDDESGYLLLQDFEAWREKGDGDA
jgi:hypothetical protein